MLLLQRLTLDISPPLQLQHDFLIYSTATSCRPPYFSLFHQLSVDHLTMHGAPSHSRSVSLSCACAVISIQKLCRVHLCLSVDSRRRDETFYLWCSASHSVTLCYTHTHTNSQTDLTCACLIRLPSISISFTVAFSQGSVSWRQNKAVTRKQTHI